MTKTIRLAIMSVLVVSGLSIAGPASANDCSNPKPGQQCGGCQINPNFSSEDLRPIVCYV